MNNNQDYKNYNITDFVWEENFRSWVLSPDKASEAFWQQWLRVNPEKKSIIDAARTIVSALHIREPGLSDIEMDVEINEVMSGIRGNEVSPVKKRGVLAFLFHNYRSLGLTACLMIVTFLGITWYFRAQKSPSVAEGELSQAGDVKLVKRANDSQQDQAIMLPDGSSVVLKKHSTISYHNDFNSFPKRRIYLTGTALFEVKKNPAKPFLVFTNGLITEVLGTKFLINSADAGKKVSVEVISGIVAVYSFIDKGVNEETGGKKLNSLVLTANLKASYSSEDKTLMSSVVDHPMVVSTRDVNFKFEDTLIDSVFSSIQKAYGITVIYDEKTLGRRTFTATLDKESMYEKMDIICKTINANYEIIDGKIVVQINTH